MKETAGKKDSGFPITNVGNDRRGIGNDGRGPFVRNDRKGPFCMGERDADAVLKNHEANGFVPAYGYNPADPFPVIPTAPFPLIPQAPPCHSRSPPSLSFPRFLAGIQSKQSCPRGQSGIISLRQGEHDRRLARSMVSDDQ